jgi:hypothetical protein
LLKNEITFTSHVVASKFKDDDFFNGSLDRSQLPLKPPQQTLTLLLTTAPSNDLGFN